MVAALAALGGGVILAAFVVSVAGGDGSEAQWLLLGPAFPPSYPGAGSR